MATKINITHYRELLNILSILDVILIPLLIDYLPHVHIIVYYTYYNTINH